MDTKHLCKPHRLKYTISKNKYKNRRYLNNIHNSLSNKPIIMNKLFIDPIIQPEKKIPKLTELSDTGVQCDLDLLFLLEEWVLV